MTTFTMQDLNNMPTTPEEDEAMEALAKLGGGVSFHDLKVVGAITPTQHAPEPQPSAEVLHNPSPDLPTIINTICAQLQLLSSVITSSATTTQTQAEDQSLQDCVALTLQQADWFKDLVRRELIGGGIEDLAKDAVQDIVENEVESYFDHRFDPTDHFDFDSAVNDAVADQIDDVVSDKVNDSLSEVVEEKLSEASISISF